MQDQLVAAADNPDADPAALADSATPGAAEEYPLGGVDLGEFEGLARFQRNGGTRLHTFLLMVWRSSV